MEPKQKKSSKMFFQNIKIKFAKIKVWLLQRSRVLKPIWKPVVENWEILPSIIFAFLLLRLSDFDDIKRTEKVSGAIFQLSGLIAAIVIGFFSAYVIQIKRERLEKLPKINNLTQMLTSFRKIINVLLKSHNFWEVSTSNTYLPLYIDKQYKNLSYFEYNEGKFVGKTFTDEARNFMDDKMFGNTKYLYLELKSFLPKHNVLWGDETLLTEFDGASTRYSVEFLEKLIRHDCGTALWNFFDNDFNLYKKNLKFEEILEHDKGTILSEATKIDKDRYKGMELGADLLSKIGIQITEFVIPTLYYLEKENKRAFPYILNYLYVILTILLVVGVLLPSTAAFLQASPKTQPICSILILSTALYLIMSFRKRLLREIEI